MAKFYKQEMGVIVIPKDYDRFHVSWTLNNILEGFKLFHKQHGRWPIGIDLRSCPYLPNAKTLERNFGGIVAIRKELGVAEPHFNAGSRRSNRATSLWTRGFELEEEIYTILVKRFHEPFVHNQGRVNLGEGKIGRADFIVYHNRGKFIVDVFFSDTEYSRFAINMAVKTKTYNHIDHAIFLVIGNPDISKQNIDRYLSSTKSPINLNLNFLTKQDFINTVGDFQPLENPTIC